MALSAPNVDINAIATMTEWGIDLAHVFHPKSLTLLSFLKRRNESDLQTLKAFHDLADSKDAYDKRAESWLVNAWIEEQGKHIYLVGVLTTVRDHLVKNHNALKLLLPHLRPGHYELPIRERLSFFSTCMTEMDGDILRFILREDGTIRAQDIEQLGKEELGILKLVAWSYKATVHTHPKASPGRRRWQSLTRQVIKLTTNLHSQAIPPKYFVTLCFCSSPLGTPLHAVISGQLCPPPQTFTTWRRVTERALQLWLEDLLSCRTNLSAYGKSEEDLFLGSEELWPFRYLQSLECCTGAICRLASFQYGPRPQDWKFYWDLQAEDMAGDFWYLIENPPLKIIGAWVDD